MLNELLKNKPDHSYESAINELISELNEHGFFFFRSIEHKLNLLYKKYEKEIIESVKPDFNTKIKAKKSIVKIQKEMIFIMNNSLINDFDPNNTLNISLLKRKQINKRIRADLKEIKYFLRLIDRNIS